MVHHVIQGSPPGGARPKVKASGQVDHEQYGQVDGKAFDLWNGSTCW